MLKSLDKCLYIWYNIGTKVDKQVATPHPLSFMSKENNINNFWKMCLNQLTNVYIYDII